MYKVLAKQNRKRLLRTYELAYRLALGGQTNLQVCALSDQLKSQVEASCCPLLRDVLVAFINKKDSVVKTKQK